MAEVSYSYRVRVGSHEWAASSGDPAEYGPVDGLSIIRKLVEDSPLWPAQLDTAECRFQLIVASMADVSDVAVGTPVLVEIQRPAGGPVREAFTGRVADLSATPHKLGMLLTLACLDYTGDLRNITVGAEPWPVETIFQRVTRIMGLAGQPAPVPLALPPGSGVMPLASPSVAARDVDAQNAYDLVQHYLDQWPVDYGYAATSVQYRGRGRMNLSAQTDANGVLTGWLLVPQLERPYYAGPLVLTNVAGVWRPVVDADSPNTDPVVLMADEVDVSSTYAITKQDSVTRVTVSGDKFIVSGVPTPVVVSASLDVDPPVVATLDGVEITDPGTAAVLAAMYLPGEVPVSRWIADSFLWHLELADVGRTIPDIGVVVTVGGIVPAQNPNGQAWFTGQLAAHTFTLADKRPTYLFQLRRPDWTAGNQSDLVTWQSAVLTQVGGPTWATIDPSLTWDDMRLLRGTTT